jgi:hemerythrin superfamily protein
MAIACLRLFTFLPERPDLRLPRFRSCMAFLTLDFAFLPYFAIHSSLAPLASVAAGCDGTRSSLSDRTSFVQKVARRMKPCGAATGLCNQGAGALFYKLEVHMAMNAITLLKKDHRKVERLFEQYRSTPNGKRGLIEQITAALSAHMDAEEGQLYPVLRSSIPDGERLMEDAEREHREARGLLAEVQNAEPTSFDTDAKMATLRRAVDHHVQEEEGEIFPRMEQSLGKARIEQIGAAIGKAKGSAPRRAPVSAAKNSPGSSVTGVLAAATDRVARLLIPGDRKPAKRSPGPARSRKTALRRKKTSTRKAKSGVRNRAARRTARKVSGKSKAISRSRKMKTAGRRARRN